ncbi:NAD-dependent epimerase/dehydratase family protein [Jannaschia sp. R86511]|uniref:NAD-dependent epimerase/dehydratase family protein n=1 Tax=Jannaschia sp. R86511 TaxID=3093853 RepID=UPI0036D3A7DC
MTYREHNSHVNPSAIESPKNVLVTGGTGKTGRRVAARLHERGVAVRALSRAGDRPFDWQDEGTWEPAVAGVDAVYVAYSPDLAVPGAGETVTAFAATAVAAGARRLVLLSGRGEPAAQKAEQQVAAAANADGATCTVVRASWFAQNFSEDYLLDAVLSGVLALPVGDVPEPFVDADDIADVAAAALMSPGHGGRTYEVTGPRLLTFADAAREISVASGRPLRVERLSRDGYADMLTAVGVPPEAVELLGYLFAEVLDGRNAHLAHGVEQALGRAPRDFSGYARRAAATGVWRHPAPASTS